MNRRHFQRGYGKTVFFCAVCKRRTRIVDQDLSSRLCPQCYELAGYDNTHNDNGTVPTAEEMKIYEAMAESAIKSGGVPERIHKAFSYIWRSEKALI